MKDLMVVASYTIKDMLKRKSFIISSVIILVLIVIGINIPNIMNAIKGDETSSNVKMLIVDSQNIFEGNLSSLGELGLGYDFTITNDNLNIDDIKQKLESGEIDSCINITKQDDTIKLDYIVESMSMMNSVPTELAEILSSLYTNVQISKLDLTRGTT